MIDYPSPGVRKAELKSLEQHCVAIANIAKQTQTGQVYSGVYTIWCMYCYNTCNPLQAVERMLKCNISMLPVYTKYAGSVQQDFKMRPSLKFNQMSGREAQMFGRAQKFFLITVFQRVKFTAKLEKSFQTELIL